MAIVPLHETDHMDLEKFASQAISHDDEYRHAVLMTKDDLEMAYRIVESIFGKEKAYQDTPMIIHVMNVLKSRRVEPSDDVQARLPNVLCKIGDLAYSADEYFQTLNAKANE